MSKQQAKPVIVGVRCVEYRGGTGLARMPLEAVPEWLDARWKEGKPTVIEQIIR